MERSEYIPDLVVNMVATGEKTGELPMILNVVVDYFDKDIDETTKNIFNIFEPVLIMLIGLMVGFMAVALLLPIFNLPGLVG